MTVAISRQLEQKLVKRCYYHGEFVPPPKDFVAIIKRDVKAIAGFDFVDLVGVETEDLWGARFFQYTALFQRDGTTLEAQIDKQNERLIEEMQRDPNDTIQFLAEELKIPETRPQLRPGDDPGDMSHG